MRATETPKLFKRQGSLDHRVQQALRVVAEAVESLALIVHFLEPFLAKLGAHHLKSSSN